MALMVRPSWTNSSWLMRWPGVLVNTTSASQAFISLSVGPPQNKGLAGPPRYYVLHPVVKLDL